MARGGSRSHRKRKPALRVAPATTKQKTASEQTKLPAEVISHIISFFVAGGLTFSTDPQHESDVATIRALLATNLQIKRETLRQIYHQPLFINITNACSCGCFAVEVDRQPVHEVTIVKKILYLPLQKWPELVIRFIPTKRATMCDLDDTKALRGNDPIGIHFDSAIRGIKRQSDWLARFLRFQYNPVQRYSRDLKDQIVEKTFLTTLALLKYDPTPKKYHDEKARCLLNIGFFFDGFGFEESRHSRAPRNVPLWEWDMVVGLLHEWLWSTTGDRSQIRLPEVMAAAFTPANDPTIPELFPHNLSSSLPTSNTDSGNGGQPAPHSSTLRHSAFATSSRRAQLDRLTNPS
ncbi:hypothetical protein H2200_011690 [Cladophialophora chaetospira]|uniref:Uncharacterized protein n=1 Tax=Cladophialophora chaetospira TaxID=386627 RepID=A0AA38WYJ6_9EURO|nr:hypothetical protein H2200_011690 [Cladophialophora chaetospira]